MKLLLIAAAMVGSAYGACIRATDVQLAAANIVGGEAVVAASAANAVGTCAAGWTGAGPTATDCASAGGVVTWTGCTTRWAACTIGATATSCATCAAEADRTSATTCATCNSGSFPAAGVCAACTCGTNAATCTCTDATAANTDILTCSDGYVFTAKISVVGNTDGVTGVTGDALACPTIAPVTAVTAVTAVTTAVASSCAATACSGEQTGCVATKTTDNTCSTGGKLKCTESATGYTISDGAVTACASSLNVATYVAYVTGTATTCQALTCNAGWILKASDKTCGVANSCTAGAVPAMYAATGIATTTVAAVTRVCPATCDATPPTGTCTAGVTEVTGVAAKLASAATTVDGLGTVTCATGFTGTAVAACPTADGAFTYTGCAAAAAPASVAQTIVAFVLTVVAMYL